MMSPKRSPTRAQVSRQLGPAEGAVVLALWLLTLAGCPAHVQLPPLPGADAPYDERVSTYGELRPVGLQTGSVYYTYQGFIPQLGQRVEYLELANGLRVRRAEDLLQAVPPGSPTASACVDARREQEAAEAWSKGIIGTVAGGTAVTVVGLGLLGYSLATYQDGDGPAWFIAAGGTAGLGVLGLAATSVPLVPLLYHLVMRDRAKVGAFQTYDEDLRARLGFQLE